MFLITTVNEPDKTFLKSSAASIRSQDPTFWRLFMTHYREFQGLVIAATMKPTG